MVITVFGLGFVGLTTALGFAEKGIKVYGIETDADRMATIAAGTAPFLEPGLDEALVRHLHKNFYITCDVTSAVSESDCVFYCVGTPYGESGMSDLTDLYTAIANTLAVINDDKFRVLVIKSTVPPSTTNEKIIPYIDGLTLRTKEQIGVANNPEFLREGHCWDDFMEADRIVIGVADKRSEQMLRKLYAPFDIPVFAVTLNTAEYIKYLSNTMLATLISFSNEMAEIAHMIGDIQIAEAFKIIHLDKRWGGCRMTDYVYPGCGYGGYCLPKDTNALLSMMNTYDLKLPLLSAVIQTNDAMADIICDRITQNLNVSATIGILGLAFKPGSDDVRDTPAAKIMKGLQIRGFTRICAYDPVATKNFQNCYDIPAQYLTSLEETARNVDILVILTAWEEFKDVYTFGKPVCDCRYMLQQKEKGDV